MSNRSMLKPEDIPDIVLKLYGLEVNVVRELESYDDQNFHVTVPPGTSVPTRIMPVCHDGYVFKILNSCDSQKPELIDLQTQMILHTSTAGYPSPVPVAINDNQYQEVLELPKYSESPDGCKAGYVVRLFEFMPGMRLDQVPLTNQLCYEIGLYAGKLDKVLKEFQVKDSTVLSSLTIYWNMSEIPEIRSKLHAVSNQEQLDVVMEIIDTFEREVLACQHKFSKGLIHGDFNDCNILVTTTDDMAQIQKEGKINHAKEPNGNTWTENPEMEFPNHAGQIEATKKQVSYHISGIIDFGDSAHSLYLFEVAIAMVYVMVNTSGIPPMQAASQVLAGYLKHMKLSDHELQHLKICILARFAQSLVLGYFCASKDPGNDYISKHTGRIWPALKSLWSTEDSLVLQQLMEFVDTK